MFAIMKWQKIKTRAQLLRAINHNLRLVDVPNADRKRANQYMIGSNKGDDIEAAIDERLANVQGTIRKDAVRVMEAVLSASPEYFRPDDPSKAGTWDEAKLKPWLDESMKYLKSTFGNNLVSVVLHLDEATPHLQVLMTPINEKDRLSAKTMFSPQTLENMQSDYANALKPLGLERGIKGSEATYQKVSAFYGLIDEALELPKVSTMDKAKLAMGQLPHSVFQTQAVAEVARDEKRKRKETQATNVKLATQMEKVMLENSQLRRQVADQARGIPLDKVMAMLGAENLKDKDENNWQLPNLGRTTVDPDNKFKFYSHDEGKGGGGAIDLVMMETGMKFAEAINFLRVDVPIDLVANEASLRARMEIKSIVKGTPADVNSLAPASDKIEDLKRVGSYMTNERLIDADLIAEAINSGSLSATSSHSLINARWTLQDEKGSTVGFALEGTSGRPFKGIRGTKGICVLGERANPDTIIVAESPIDAMSLASISKKGIDGVDGFGRTMMIGTMGTSTKSLETISDIAKSKPSANVVIGFDNDQIGIKMAMDLEKKLKAKGVTKVKPFGQILKGISSYVGETLSIKVKDWNDALKVVKRRFLEPASRHQLNINLKMRIAQSNQQVNVPRKRDNDLGR